MQRGSLWKKCSDEAALMEIANPASLALGEMGIELI
jgi:hypothetical protein